MNIKRRDIQKKLGLILGIICGVLSCSSVFLASLATSTQGAVRKEAILNYYTNELKVNNVNKTYCYFEYKNDYDNPIWAFQNLYGQNFYNEITTLPCITTNKELTSFTSFYNNKEVPINSAVFSGIAYTNDFNTLQFETVPINLLTYRSKAEEIGVDTSKYDGGIYIPDFYADYLIENNDNLNDYFDLFKDDIDSNMIKIKCNNLEFKYKIANIFHVKGFNEKYSHIENYQYNDSDIPSYILECCNCFFMVTNLWQYHTISEEFNTSLYMHCDAKRYTLEEKIDYCSKINNDNHPDIKLFYKNGDKLKIYDDSAYLKDCYDHDTFFNTRMLLFTISAVLFLIVFFALILLIENDKLLNLIFSGIALLNILFLLVAFILKKILVGNYLINLYLNKWPLFASAIIVISVIIFIIFDLISSIVEKRKKV